MHVVDTLLKTPNTFFQCPTFNEPRIKLFRELRRFCPLSLQLLLFRSDNLDLGENSFIFISVQNFIRETKRFDFYKRNKEV